MATAHETLRVTPPRPLGPTPGEAQELVELLARQMPIVLGAVFVVAPTALYVHMLRLGGGPWAQQWLMLALGLAAVRAAFVAGYWRWRAVAPLGLWRAGFALGSLASGSLFGWFGWVAAQSGDGPMMVFTIMMLVGLTAGSVASLSADRVVYAAFALSAMGPVVVRFALAPDEPSRAMAVLGFVFVITHLGYSMLQNRTMRDLIRLRNQEQALARDLEEARDRAERSSSEKTRFLLAAGHDLRQPLYAIRLLLDRLETDDAATRKAHVATIGESVGAISGLLERMLEAARAGSKGYSPRLGPVELDGILRQVGVEFAVDAFSKSLDLCFVGTTRWAWTDPALLTQILRNFVGNAVRYTAQGRVLVGVRQRGDQLEIQVWDSGSGIAEADIPKIFEPFHQLANPGRQYGGGYGLGLTIARGMADIIGGEIIVRSRIGKGSMFSITIPRAVPPAPSRLPIPEAKSPVRALASGHVLLVEDHDPVRAILKDLLTAWGYSVSAFSSAEAAMAHCLENALIPDVIISDFRLPGEMDGLSLIRALRAKAEQALPALLVTADPAAPSPGEGITVLTKPIGSKALQRALEAVLPIRSGQSARETP